MRKPFSPASRSLQEEVANKGENPAWVIKLKNQREQFEKDAKQDMNKNLKQREEDAFRSPSNSRKDRRGVEKKRDKKKEKKRSKTKKTQRASEESQDEARA